MAKRIQSWISLITPEFGTIVAIAALLLAVIAYRDFLYLVKKLWTYVKTKTIEFISLVTTLVNNTVTAIENIRIS